MGCPASFLSERTRATDVSKSDHRIGRIPTQVTPAFFAWVLLFLCLLAPGSLLAQQAGSINGNVTDPSGGSVANAQVTLTRTGQGTQLHGTSNSSGEYSFPALDAGTYSLQVIAPGFEEFDTAGIVLRVSRTERVDAKLTVGSVNTKVEVSGEELGAVQTESPEISFTITGKQITQIVLNGRNFSQLVTLSPGVINQTGQDEGETGVGGSVSYSINGGRTEYNNWELDGSSLLDNGSNSTLNVYPDVDAIAETQVLTSNYGAQYGRNASGTVLAQTKSGTEGFHGDVFEFLRNDAFNARNYFETSVPTYKKHDYGFTIGGPVRIPHLYDPATRKTFFFYSQEWRHENVPGTVFHQQVPSDAERTGNFADLCPSAGSAVDTTDFPDCPVDPTTGNYFANNQVTIDPNGQALLALIPAANTGSGTSSFYNASPAQLTTNREELFRIDQVVSPKLRGFFRFIYDSWATVSNPPTFQSNSFPTVQNSFAGPGIDMVANLTYAATPSLVNEFVADYTTDHITLINTTPSIDRSNFTGSGFFNNGYGGVLPSISVTGNNAYSGGSSTGGFNVNTGYFPWQNSNPSYTYRDNLTKTFRDHTFIFGASYIAVQKNEPSVGNRQGEYDFASSSAVSTGNAFADLLVGRVSRFTQSSLQPKYYFRYKIFEPYFQDNWRATPKLTLNMGLRVSLFGTYRDISKQSGNFEPGAYNAAAAAIVDADGSISDPNANLFNGIVVCGTAGSPPGCQTGHLFNPAPRVGFAYDVFGNGKLSVRGGYGVFFEHTNGNESNAEYLENTAPVVQNPQRFAFVGYNAGGAATLFPLSNIEIPTKAVWPYVQQYNLAVQGQLPSHTVLQVAYVGSVSRHLPLRVEGNQLQPVVAAENPYGAGQAISAADCAPSNFTVISAPGAPVQYAATVNGQPVSTNVANHLAVACGNSADPLRPFLGVSTITHSYNVASANYNALQVGVSRYFGRLNGSLAYTYGHSIDDASDGGTGGSVRNAYNISANRATSDFDEKHLVELSLVYDLPIFVKPGLLHDVLGGWQVSDLTSFQTGNPFNITNNGTGAQFDNAGTGNGVTGVQSAPDIVGDIHAKPAIGHPAGQQGPRLYNSDAFAAPQGLTYGDAGRNIFRNPKRTNYDVGVFKNFTVREGMHFELRGEGFNVFNHTQWSSINNSACYGASNCATDGFLTATAAHSARKLQVAGKFVF